MNKRIILSQSGFTMIELILTLVLAGIAGAMILPLFQSGVINSGTPVYRLESLAQLEATMANISAAVRQPSTTTSEQNPYQYRNEEDAGNPTAGGMQKLKEAIDNSATFSQWVPAGASITATTVGPLKLGQYASPSAISGAYDQNYVLQVTLTASDGATLTHYFCEGSNYQVTPDGGWGGDAS